MPSSRYYNIAIFLLLSGCASSGMSTQMQGAIPANATAVVLHSDSSADALYGVAFRTLREQGFRYDETNDEMMSISTQGMMVGQSQTRLRIDIFVEPAQGGSQLTATAEYLLTPGSWLPVAYKHSGTKYKIGFEELVLLIREIAHDRITYVADEARARRAFSI